MSNTTIVTEDGAVVITASTGANAVNDSSVSAAITQPAEGISVEQGEVVVTVSSDPPVVTCTNEVSEVVTSVVENAVEVTVIGGEKGDPGEQGPPGDSAAVDDTPVDGSTDTAISSNWAHDHLAHPDPHADYVTKTELASDIGAVTVNAGYF